MTQDTIIESDPDNDTLGAIPKHRKLKITELVTLKYLTSDAKERLSTVVGAVKTYNLWETFKEPEDTVDDIGWLLDDITKYCNEELRKAELPKKRKGGKI